MGYAQGQGISGKVGRGVILPSLRRGLLAATALLSAGLPVGIATAQEVIDGGATVSVPGTQASPWNIVGLLTVGDAAAGTLSISGGGEVSDDDAVVGNGINAIGSVTVTGAGSSWTSVNGVVIGQLGTGDLQVSDGGEVHSLAGTIGGLVSGDGTATVTGNGSLWELGDYLHVGEVGQAGLTIADGGGVVDVDGVISYNGIATDAPDVVTVTGAGSTWTNSNLLIVGVAGAGALNIEDGGYVQATSGIDLGASAGSSGSITVDGLNSLLEATTGSVTVGMNDEGILTISNGGRVSSFGGEIGAGGGGRGGATVTGAGSKWESTAVITVGSFGNGTLDILDGGMVTSTTANVGVNSNSTGSVKVDGAGSVWSITGNFTVGDAGEGELTIANGGTVTGPGVVTVGAQPGMYAGGTINIGGKDGASAEAPGTLDVAAVQFGDSPGNVRFNHTGTAYVFAPELVTAGIGESGIVQVSGTTILTAISSGFTGYTEIQGGKLVVNGILSGSEAYVHSGATLGGSGTIGGIDAKAGGIVAPGNSIGTLIVAADASFESGSIFAVEVNDAGASDRLDVTGIATLAGGVEVQAAPGNYAPSTQYIILSATGGITGSFSGVISDLVFLSPTLSYDATAVTLTLDRNATAFADIGTTPNQKATGAALQPLGGGNTLYDAILPLDVPTALNAFDQLSGELHPTLKGVLLDHSRFVRDAVLNRTRPQAGAPDGDMVSAYAATPQPAAVAATGLPKTVAPDTSYWLASYGGLGALRSDGNAASSSAATGGFILGADGHVGGWTVGLLGDLGLSALSVPDRNSTATSSDFGLGIYGDTRWAETGFTLGASYTRHAIGSSRHVVFPGIDETLTANYGAATAQAFAELSHKLEMGKATLEPFASIAYVNHSTDGFSETGGAAALSSAGDMLAATFTTLGLRGSAELGTADTIDATLTGSVAWRHSFSSTPTAGNSFAGGAPVSIAGVPLDSDTALVDAGLSFDLAPATTLAFSYSGAIGISQQSHALKVSFGGAF